MLDMEPLSFLTCSSLNFWILSRPLHFFCKFPHLFILLFNNIFLICFLICFQHVEKLEEFYNETPPTQHLESAINRLL